MLRTIVDVGPPQPSVAGDVAAVHQSANQAPVDGYLEKLIKYVPVEVLAIFVPLAAATQDQRWLSWVVFVAGIVATVGYLMLRANPLPAKKRPRLYTYPISALAFCFWAAGASATVRSLFSISATVTEVFLGLSVLLIPLVDFGCRETAEWWRKRSHRHHLKSATAH